MDAQAVEQAKVRLKRAAKALEALKSAAGYEEAEEAWSDFLLAASTIYTKLEQGSKSNGKSAGWYGRKKNERRRDPLMRFLHQARNSDEHGIERVAERGGNPRELFSGRKLKFNERIEYRIERDDGKPIGSNGEQFTMGWFYGPSLTMIRVHDRLHKDSCDPPTEHMGKPLERDDNSLIGVASLGLTYLRSLVAEAETLV